MILKVEAPLPFNLGIHGGPRLRLFLGREGSFRVRVVGFRKQSSGILVFFPIFRCHL